MIKKFLFTILIALLVIIPTTLKAFDGFSIDSLLYENGGALYPVDASWTLGSSGTAFGDAYFTSLTAGTLSVTSTIESDFNLNGNKIYNGYGEFTPNVDIEGSDAVYGSSILTDGGLENWDDANTPTDWDVYDTGADASVNRESTEVYAGTYSAKLTMASGAPAPAVIQQNNTGLTAGTIYRARAYAKTDDSCDFYFNVLNGPFDTADEIYNFTTDSWDAFTGTEQQNSDYQSNQTITSSFVQYTSGSFTVPTNGNVNLSIASNGAVGTSVYVDAITLGTYTAGTDAQLNFVSGSDTYARIESDTSGEIKLRMNDGTDLGGGLTISDDGSNNIKILNKDAEKDIWVSAGENTGADSISGSLYLTGGSLGSGTAGRVFAGINPSGSVWGSGLSVLKTDSDGDGLSYLTEIYAPGNGDPLRVGSDNYQAESALTIGDDSEVAVGYKQANPTEIFSVKQPFGYDYVYRENSGGAFTDLTTSANDTESNPISLLESDSDYLYLGQDTQSSSNIQVNITTPGGSVVLQLEYWNGSAWTSLAIDSDGTSNLTVPGSIEFTTPADWEANTVDGQEAFWLRLSSTSAPSPFPQALNVNHKTLQPFAIYPANGDTNPQLQMNQLGQVGLGSYDWNDLSAKMTIKGLSTVSQTSALLVENAAGTDLFELKDNGIAYLLGDVGIGTDSPDTTLDIDGTVSYSPSSDTSLSAGTAITVTKGIMRVVGNGGAVTLTSTPTIVDGSDGQIVIIQGTDDTNTVTLQDDSTLANSGLQLSGGNDMTLGEGDVIQLMYDSDDDKWYEISRSDN